MNKLIYKICNKVFVIHKIKSYSFDKRLFCILDRNLPYELNIKYKELHESYGMSSTIIDGKISNIYYPKTDLYKNYSYRFTKEEGTQHCLNIKILKEKLQLEEEERLNYSSKLLEKESENEFQKLS